MKASYSKIITLLCGVIILGCQTDDTTNAIGGNGEATQLTVALPDTRTALGEKVGDTYPVHWSEGDCIVVNGVKSKKAVISNDNPNSATFDLGAALNRPFRIVYPYTETTTAEAPKVVLPTEQQYTEGSFATETAPMCGYVTDKGSKVALSHLSGVLRFPVKASVEGTVLQKIVITSLDGVKLSGDFDVDCSAKTMVASETAEDHIIYSLPENFTLSTSEESVFYITLPAGETGICKVEFVESSGEKMVYTWSNRDIKAGIIREFKPITYKRGATGSLEFLQSHEDVFEVFYPTVYGYVKDINGAPIKGVAVSDGFNIVTTDDKGYYTMDVSTDTWYIYISVPAEYEIPTNEFGQPCFYKKYPGESPQYDFVLTPLAGGKEEKFALFTFGDPQVSSATTLKRFQNEAIPSIRTHCEEIEASGVTCYGITLGDIISNGGKNTSEFRDDMRDGFSVSSVGMPVFQVMGNHDNTFFNAERPLFSDSRNSTFELKAQREHEDIFGPANYSFNRGDVHIIGMRNIIYNTHLSSSQYSTGFLQSQYEWLKQDLALVSKDKLVVLCVHIPLYNGNGSHVQSVLSLLDEYNEAHIFSGHVHTQRLYNHKNNTESNHKVYEHNTCAVCGAWWSSNIASDGTPNGYNVFIGNGNTFSDWYYMGNNEGMNTRSHQMRLYRGNAVSGADITGSNSNGTKGYYAFNFDENTLLANVYNADSDWTIEVYEDGKKTGEMTKVSTTLPNISTLIGDYTKENPRRVADGIETSHDFYVSGLLLGLLGNAHDSSAAWKKCFHMYKHTLTNKDAEIKVVAIDKFDNKYEETKITDCTDFSLVVKPVW